MSDSRLMNIGGLAHMVERPLSMREAPGSIPGSSNFFYYFNLMSELNYAVKAIDADKLIKTFD